MQSARYVISIRYPPKISALFDENNRQIVTNFASVIFNTQVKVLRNDDNLFTFINVILASLLQHKESFKGVALLENRITVILLHAADLF